MLPDIIDPNCANLVINTRTGDLALVDTNRLISTRKLARLIATGQPLDPARHRIHALFLRRLLFLDATYLGRDRIALRGDPVYARYLDAAGFDAVFAASAAAGEPIPDAGSRGGRCGCPWPAPPSRPPRPTRP
jgi:hypothetical protein